MSQRLTSAAMVVAASVMVSADNWPNWRGPTRTGSAPKEPAAEVGTAGGRGLEGAAADVQRLDANRLGRRHFPQRGRGAGEGDPLSLWCLSRADGAVRWKQPMDTGNHKVRKGDMTSPSPVTDGKTVWLLTGTGVIRAFDFKGTALWTRDLQKDYGKFGLTTATDPRRCSRRRPIVQVLHGWRPTIRSYVVRVSRQHGQGAVARRASDRRHPGVARLLHHAGAGQAARPSSSWSPAVTSSRVMIPRPARSCGDRAASTREQPLQPHRGLAGGRRRHVYAPTRSSRCWRSRRAAAATSPTPPLGVRQGARRADAGDRRQISLRRRRRGVVHCLDAKTGAIVYGPERLTPGTYSSSPVIADGRIYIPTKTA